MIMITWEEALLTFRATLRWWWVIFLATALAGGSAYYFSQNETRYYITHTTLMIGNSFEKALPDPGQLALGATLARFYNELAHRERTLRPVQEQLQLPFPWQVIRDGMLSANVVPSANFLEIYVTDSNPDRAAAIANAIGDQLMAYSPTSPEKVAAEQKVIDQQLKDSEARIKQIKDKIDELTAKKQEASSSSDIADINQTLEELNKSQTQEQQSYATLLTYKNGSSVNSLTVFERAVAPTQPLPSKRKATVAFAGIAGLLLAFLAVFVLERVDQGWRNARDLKSRFKVDNLGDIPVGPPLLATSGTAAAERLNAARDAQTNILLAAAERGSRLLMVTSPQPNESRTGFSIDLADLFGRAGHRVLLVDADFTNAFLTRLFAPQGEGQSWTITPGDGTGDIWAHLRPTPLNNVALLPGNPQANGMPALIPSLRWQQLVQHLLKTADIIIFDGPSVLNGPDAALLAPHVDGVVLALDPTKDSREDVSKSKTRLLHQKGSHLLGAVTFSPSRHELGTNSDWKQLPGEKQLALPSPFAAAGGSEPRIARSDMQTPIITPVPTTIETAESSPVASGDTESDTDIILPSTTIEPITSQTEQEGLVKPVAPIVPDRLTPQQSDNDSQPATEAHAAQHNQNPSAPVSQPSGRRSRKAKRTPANPGAQKPTDEKQHT